VRLRGAQFVAKRVQGFLIVGVSRSAGTISSARDCACCTLQKKQYRQGDKKTWKSGTLGAARQTEPLERIPIQ
jgi:hypothetical protein